MEAITEQEVVCGLAPSSEAAPYIFGVNEVNPAKKETLATALASLAMGRGTSSCPLMAVPWRTRK